MARTVQVVCARCGHSQMHVVESTQNNEAVAEIVRASGDREMAAEDTSSADAMRLQRLQSLPRSLPVGGIITPV
jgi:predicted amino acid racemase